MRVRWAGESINSVVPSAYIGGEAAKVQLLHKRGVPQDAQRLERRRGKDRANPGAGHVHCRRIDRRRRRTCRRRSPARDRHARHDCAGDGNRGVALLAAAARDVSHARAAPAHPRVEASRAESLRAARRTHLRVLSQRSRATSSLSTATYFARLDGGRARNIARLASCSGCRSISRQAWPWRHSSAWQKRLGIFVPGALGVQESGIVFLCYLFGLPAGARRHLRDHPPRPRSRLMPPSAACSFTPKAFLSAIRLAQTEGADLKAIICAAGRGVRLGARSPKVLLEIGGRTLLEWHALRLREVRLA